MQDLATLPPLPPPLPPDMLFAVAPDLARLSLAVDLPPIGKGKSGAAGPDPGVRARIGRGGRLVLDRCAAADYRKLDDPAAPADEARAPSPGSRSSNPFTLGWATAKQPAAGKSTSSAAPANEAYTPCMQSSAKSVAKANKFQAITVHGHPFNVLILQVLLCHCYAGVLR